MHTEQAYLFRHALMRDAAYALQLPAERARLHRLALAIMEIIHPDAERDPLAAEFAMHARYAQADGDSSLREAELAYTWRAAEYYRANYDPDAIRWFDAATALEQDPLRRARAMQLAADVLIMSGRSAEGLSRLLGALRLAEARSDARLQGALNFSLSMISQFQGRLAEAETLARKALALARASGDGRTEAAAINSLSVLERAAGRPDRAFDLLKQALAVTRETGNRRGESVCLGNIAMHLFEADRHDEALTACEEAVAAARDSGNRRSEGINHGVTGMILAHAGRPAEAVSSFRQALLLHRETCNRAYEAYDRCRMALALLKLGDEFEARAEWRAGYEQMLAYGDQPDVPETLNDMRRVCAESGIPPFDATSGTA